MKSKILNRRGFVFLVVAFILLSAIILMHLLFGYKTQKHLASIYNNCIIVEKYSICKGEMVVIVYNPLDEAISYEEKGFLYYFNNDGINKVKWCPDFVYVNYKYSEGDFVVKYSLKNVDRKVLYDVNWDNLECNYP